MDSFRDFIAKRVVMATSTTEDIKPILSPLDLSLKINTKDSYQKSLKTNENQFVNKTSSLDEYKSVSSEELLSLKRLHNRLSKTMELLMPQEKAEGKTPQESSSDMASANESHQFSDKSIENFDYRTTMKALLSLVGSESGSTSLPPELNPLTFDDSANSSQLQNKLIPPNFDVWSYWHEYLLSLYIMNSTLTSLTPPIPPPPHPNVSVPHSQLYPHNQPYLSPTPSSVLLHNMLNNINQGSSSSSNPANSEENNLKNLLLHETIGSDYNFKGKKQNPYQLLKDSNLLYNSFAFNRNLGLTKTKFLDSPESFGVSLRGNQKYSIYYQQRPTNIFNNNNFMTPNCQSSFSGKINATNSHKTFPNEMPGRKSQMLSEMTTKKSIPPYTNNFKLSKSLNRTDGNYSHLKLNKLSNSCDKGTKDANGEGYNSSNSNNINNIINQNIPTNLHLGSRYRETVFNCSCGEEFENLYSFTIHMKTTHHTPNSTKIDRTIPKLVRGQDMWINSETEQTKEILRCMRCHQSFRTLPELTMHMVETNHYSEIVYNDTGKCVFLNSDNDKTKSCSTVTSPILSSPGEIIRNMKRTWSNSNDSDPGEEVNFKCRKISSSPLSSSNDTENEQGPKSDKYLNEETKPKEAGETEKVKVDIVKDGKDLQINEADSRTSDIQPDSEGQLKSYNNNNSTKDFKKDNNKDLPADGLSTSDSVIRQIENFVEKNLPKSVHMDFNNSSFLNTAPTSSHRANKMSNHPFHSTKVITAKSNTPEKVNKTDVKNSIPDKIDLNSGVKSKPIDEIFSNVNYKSYQSFSTDLNENPLSSLQSLVETIQRNPTQIKDQSCLKVSPNCFQNKEFFSSSKSPISCDSLNQLQALVAGTSANSSCSSGSQGDEKKQSIYSISDNNKRFIQNEILDSSAKLLTWYHKIGELLGLPKALSQVMITPEALKDLANNVLMVQNSKQCQSESLKHTESQIGTSEDDNNNHNSYEKTGSTLTSSSKNRDCDPLEQLKNLLHTTTEVGSSSSTNIHQTGSGKFHNGINNHPNSPLAISKKAKCHFCNKPFANKGQVRLHISKGKCPSLLRSCNSNCNTVDTKTNSNLSPLNLETNFNPYNRISDSNDTCSKSDNAHIPTDNVLMSKSVNLIREYFKFARQMIGNEDSIVSPKNLVDSEIE